MNRTRSAGFVITLEFLLVMALFVVPLIIGAIMVGRKLFTLYLNQRDFIDQPYSRAVVWDSSATPKVVGPVLGYDQFEAPLVVFRDDATKGGVVLGVRRDRFTSYGEVFYTDPACTLNPQVRAWDAPVLTGALSVGSPGYNPPAGFLYQMQGVSWAMGNGNVLYSSNIPTSSLYGTNPLYVWVSQDTSPNAAIPAPTPPCFVVDGTSVKDLVPATPVIDFTTVYTAPFRAAFPTPVAGPGLPCPTNECGP